MIQPHCPADHFLNVVNVACQFFPNAPRNAPFYKVEATNAINFNLTYKSIDVNSIDYPPPVDPLYINIRLVPDPVPDYIVVQDSLSPLFYDRLIGIALDGVPMYSGLSSAGQDVFHPSPGSDSFVYQIDQCGGSYGPTPSGWRYHYRTMPTCLNNTWGSVDRRRVLIDDIHQLLDTFDNGKGPALLGFSLTGHPIYSPLEQDGSLVRGLDNCNGKFQKTPFSFSISDSVNNVTQYAYYATPVFPYIVGCDGPGVLSAGDLRVSVEQLPTLAGVHYDQCPGGFYPSSDFASNGCVACPAGKYSMRTGRDERTACGAVCPVGHYCIQGSTLPVKCPGGTYGSRTGLTDASCSGLCTAGYFCPPGSQSPDSHPCGNETVYCPPGSARRSLVAPSYYSGPLSDVSEHFRFQQIACEPGSYCTAGRKMPCPAGRYGEVYNLQDENCTDLCPPGHFCPLGSVSPLPCPAGTYGATLGLKDASCSGLCNPGYYCPASSVSATEMMCPPGIYGAEFGLTTAQCSPLCEPGGGPNATTAAGTKRCEARACSAGYICPPHSSSATQVPCGSAAVYCPPRSVIATPVSLGHYTVGPLSAPGAFQSPDDAEVRVSQRACEVGYWCSGGVRTACPRGYYGGTELLNTSTCSGQCDAGFICETASYSPQQSPCGADSSVYCPKGSFAPTLVPAGYYSLGGSENTRQYIKPCPAGMYCINGVKALCPAGRYSSAGSPSEECDGLCAPGYYCPAGSSSITQVPCPAGRFGLAGMQSSACSGGCSQGYYCPLHSTSATQVECGGEYFYCPRGSPAPVPVSLHHYSTGGGSTTRTAQELCVTSAFTGSPPASSARTNICPSTTVMV